MFSPFPINRLLIKLDCSSFCSFERIIETSQANLFLEKNVFWFQICLDLREFSLQTLSLNKQNKINILENFWRAQERRFIYLENKIIRATVSWARSPENQLGDSPFQQQQKPIKMLSIHFVLHKNTQLSLSLSHTHSSCSPFNKTLQNSQSSLWFSNAKSKHSLQS